MVIVPTDPDLGSSDIERPITIAFPGIAAPATLLRVSTATCVVLAYTSISVSVSVAT
jgi:hypothetical protein